MKLIDLKRLETKAKKATRGIYSLEEPNVKTEEELDSVTHGGWRTDTRLVVENAYDPVNEESYEKNKTPHQNRRTYNCDEILFNEFNYRGPAQTHANAEYFAALDPDTILKLIELAKKGLGE